MQERVGRGREDEIRGATDVSGAEAIILLSSTVGERTNQSPDRCGTVL